MSKSIDLSKVLASAAKDETALARAERLKALALAEISVGIPEIKGTARARTAHSAALEAARLGTAKVQTDARPAKAPKAPKAKSNGSETSTENVA